MSLPLLGQVGFYLVAALMIAGALSVVFSRSVVYAALSLLVTFLSIACLFVLLNAPFIAAAQILVYAVGLTIVLIFGIMFTGDKPLMASVEKPSLWRWLGPIIASASVLGVILGAVLRPNMSAGSLNGLFTIQSETGVDILNLPGAKAIVEDGGIGHIGQLLFTQYGVAFELASILLLLATIGAIILSKREYPEEEGQVPLEIETLAPGSGVVPDDIVAARRDVIGVH